MTAKITPTDEVRVEGATAGHLSLPDLHDRITEAYFGKFGDEFARATRDRIHWICQNVEGPKVLDVGCSQGIADILLGREGHEVTGLDVAVQSISQAEEYLRQEPSHVRGNVRFLAGDFLRTTFDEVQFNTVIMSEVLEHLTQPSVFVRTAAKHLVPGGRLIVTVPFGVNDWPDHKQTFYLMEPWSLLNQQFDISGVKIFGKWIGLVATKRAKNDAVTTPAPNTEYLYEAERIFQQSERELLTRSKALAKDLGLAQVRIKETTKEIGLKVREVADLSQALAALEVQEQQGRTEIGLVNRELAAIRVSHQALQDELKLAQVEKKALSDQVVMLEERSVQLSQEFQDVLDKSLRLEGSLRATETTVATAEQEVGTLKAQVVHLSREHAAAMNKIKILQQRKDDAQAKLAKSRDTISYRLGSALVQGTKSWRAAFGLPRKLYEIEMESRRRRRTESNAKILPTESLVPRDGQKNSTDHPLLPAREAPSSGEAKVELRECKGLAVENVRLLLEEAKALPVSNGSRYHRKIDLKVGIITDEYMFNFYRDVFSEIFYLSPSNYEEIMSTVKLDIVIYVTSWKGLRDEEWRGINFRPKPAAALETILELARKDGANLVFQSIEDPSNFEYFLPIAKKFDFIFTSDQDTIEKYRTACGHDNVFYGEYGANPLLNNPIGSRRNVKNAAFFAGSWAARYPERTADMSLVLDSIKSSGAELVIADRNFDANSQDLSYPPQFEEYLMPPVEHELLQSMHKLFRFNLNFNSIKGSSTMCAMRVYELQAMGVGILSNYARSVFNKFPEIRIVPWEQDLASTFELPIKLDEYRNNMSLVRNVLSDRTSFDIANRIVSKLGMKTVDDANAICVIGDPDSGVVKQSFERQHYRNKILVSPEEVATDEKWAAFRAKHSVSYFTWFTENDEYERHYLSDLVNGFKYTNSRYITRLAWFDGVQLHAGPQHEYTTQAGGRARTLFLADEFFPSAFGHLEPHEIISELQGGYAIDPFELNYIRYCEANRTDLPKPVLSVIVPVFNNGRFLKAKCLQSLQRNTLWPQFEVLLIDDGSSDPETIAIAEELVREHANIKHFAFNDGGSGSASRPRNKGIELATADLISFLDPDNEISPEGYDKLCALFAEAGRNPETAVDFVSGYHVKVEEQAKSIGKHASKSLHIVQNPRQNFLNNGKFPVVPTQPAVIARHLFDKSELRFVEASAGQDTLFGWELLCQSTRAAFTDEAYLIYYSQRSDSVTNTVDRAYFQKKVILERAQVEMLKKHGLLSVYLDKHYERFMRDWYMVKLSQVVDQDERRACEVILTEIAELYGRNLSVN